MENLTIGRTAHLAGVGVETIRFYERKGLIEQPPRPRDGGYRIYSSEAIRKIRFIQHAQELGFSLKEIDALLSLRADPGSDCSAVRTRARKKLAEIESRIARLQKIAGALEGVIESCPSQGALSGCSILAAMDTLPDG